MHAFEARQARATVLRDLLETTRLRAGELSPEVTAKLPGDAGKHVGETLAQVLRQPELRIEDLRTPIERDLRTPAREPLAQPWLDLLATIPATDPLPAALRNEWRAVETEAKYGGYLAQQQRSIDRLKAAEDNNGRLMNRRARVGAGL